MPSYQANKLVSSEEGVFHRRLEDLHSTDDIGYEKQQNYLSPNSPNETSLAKPQGRFFRIAVPHKNPDIARDNVAQKKKTSVNGSILRVHELSVDIEVYVNRETHSMSIPLEICPENIYSGMPITFSQQIIDGVRKNIISTRPSDPLTKKEQEFLDSINFTESGD